MTFQALEEEIIRNKVGKLILYIFMEWGQLPTNKVNCRQFPQWVEHFYQAGYRPLDSGESQGLTDLIGDVDLFQPS